MAVNNSRPSGRRPHTTIGLRKATKDKLDQARAPGQCYDGFLCQLIDVWEGASYESKVAHLLKRSKG